MEVKRAHLGEDHIDTGVNYYNAGTSYMNYGEYENAMDAYLKALDIYLDHHGEAHQRLDAGEVDAARRAGVAVVELVAGVEGGVVAHLGH